MTTVEKTIEVNEPVRTVYNQWTQFEEFPNFMEGVEKVVQLDDTRLHWVAEIAGVKREWDAKIEEQLPDKRIAWRSTTGEKNAGTVNFEPVSQNQTKVTLRLDYEPDDVVEKAGASLGFLSKQVEGDLERFKNFIENRTVETGAWRGEVR
jgi:uncharacterized membrane protein